MLKVVVRIYSPIALELVRVQDREGSIHLLCWRRRIRYTGMYCALMRSNIAAFKYLGLGLLELELELGIGLGLEC